MIDEILQTRHKKHVKDLNIVPILDMLVTVIFFLLMSTSFIEYTKLTLPPSSTVTSSSASNVPPLAPQIKVSHGANHDYLIQLSWGGTSPGQRSVSASEEQVLKHVHQLIQEFSQNHTQEKTLQVSMDRSVKYQILISLMDGARDFLPDIVLTSYEGKTP